MLGRSRDTLIQRPLAQCFGPRFTATFQDKLAYLPQLNRLALEAPMPDGGQGELLLDLALVPWDGEGAVMALLRDPTRRESQEREAIFMRAALAPGGESPWDAIFVVDSTGQASPFPDGADPGAYRGLAEMPRTEKGREAFDKAWSGTRVALPNAWYRVEGGDSRLLRLEFIPIKPGGKSVERVLMVVADGTRQRLVDEHRRRADRQVALGLFTQALLQEFNTLLSTISAHAEALRRDLGPGKLPPPAASAIQEAVQQAAALLKRSSDQGQALAGPQEQLDLNALIQETAPLLPHLLDKGIRVRLELGDRLPLVRGDARMLRAALAGFARQAEAQMPAGGELVLRTRRVENMGAPPGAALELADSGTGLDPLQRQQALEGSIPPVSAGLRDPADFAFARAVLRLHKATLDLETASGRGNCWRMVFPGEEARPNLTGPAAPKAILLDMDQAEPALVRAAQSRARVTSAVSMPTEIPVVPAEVHLPVGGRIRILLADDEESVLEFTRDALRGAGYEVTAVTDGQQAFERFADAPGEFALVILDAYMPQLGGLEAFLRMQSLRPDLSVLFVSGFVRGATKDALRSASPGQVEVLLKPFGVEALLETVRRSIERAAAKKK